MKTCIHCKSLIDDRASVCPYCTKDQPNTTLWMFVFFAVMVGLALIVEVFKAIVAMIAAIPTGAWFGLAAVGAYLLYINIKDKFVD